MTADLDRLRAALDAAATTDPVPEAWDAIHERVATGEVVALPPVRRRTPALAAAAVLLAVLALAGVGLAVGRDDGSAVTAAGGSQAYCDVLAGEARTRIAVVVFLTADAVPDEVEAAIAATGRAEDVTYVDQATSYSEAQAMFADEPTLRDLLRPEDVPTSFRLTVASAADAGVLAGDLEGGPGVLAVEDDRVWRQSVLDVLHQVSEIHGSIASLVHPRWVDPDVEDALTGAAPDDLAAEVATLAPALVVRFLPGPAERDAAWSLVRDAAERCGLRPEQPSGPPASLPGGPTTTEAQTTTTLATTEPG